MLIYLVMINPCYAKFDFRRFNLKCLILDGAGETSARESRYRRDASTNVIA